MIYFNLLVVSTVVSHLVNQTVYQASSYSFYYIRAIATEFFGLSKVVFA